MKQYYSWYTSPFCKIGLVANGTGLTHVHLQTGEGKRSFKIDASWKRDDRALAEPKNQLTLFFSGKSQVLDYPLDLQGTDFQRRVWKALQTIPFGHVQRYQDIARTIEHPKAARAVGMANSRNPLPLFIPCHRVIGTNGKLTGFAHGLEIKKKLLQFESAIVNQTKKNSGNVLPDNIN